MYVFFFQGVTSCPAYEMDFSSAKAKRDRLETLVSGDGLCPASQREKKSQLPVVAAPTLQECVNLFSKLNINSKKSAPAPILKVLPEYSDQFAEKLDLLPDYANMKLLYVERSREMNLEDIGSLCQSIQIPRLSQAQVREVEMLTKNQNETQAWYAARYGRITASKMHAACHTNPEKPAKTIMLDVCPQDSCESKKGPRIPAIEWGKKNELKALKDFEESANKCHSGLSMRKCGFFISTEHSFIGASPDAIVECSCCGTGCVEVKCPFTKRFETVAQMANDENFYVQKQVDGAYQVVKKHPYYYQMQCQLLVTGVQYCDFVVWSLAGVHTIRVLPDATWRAENIPKATAFFQKALLPELVARQFSRFGLEKRPLPLSPTKVSPPPKKKKVKI